MGCAAIAKKSVIPAIKSLPNKFKLVAVASRSKTKADNFSSIFKCDSIIGYDALLNRDDIDAIYMPLPTGLHKGWILRALSKNKHVYSEKSIATCFADSKRMVELATKRNLALMEGYMFQYHSQHQEVFKILQSGKIGNVRHFSASFGFPPLNPDNFRYNNEIGGGALLDCAGYVVRASFFILQQKLKVKAATVFYSSDTSIFGSAYLQGERGVAASVSFGFDNFYQCNYIIWGSKGKLTLKKAFTPKKDEKPICVIETDSGIENISFESDNHFIGAFSAFYNSITCMSNRHCLYNEILNQSESLTKIETISKNNQ